MFELLQTVITVALSAIVGGQVTVLGPAGSSARSTRPSACAIGSRPTTRVARC
jgi:hypothetical protein